MRQTSTWSAWAPGLVRAIQLAIMQLQDVAPQVKKFSIEQWRQHVRQNHIPFRRDCRLCIEEMGQDLPHRRRRGLGGESVYVMAVDVAGPFIKGSDLGGSQDMKYALIATVPIPLEVAKKGGDPEGSLQDGECQGPGSVPGSQALGGHQALGGSQVHGDSQDPRGDQECVQAAEDQGFDGALQPGAVRHGGAQRAQADPADLELEVGESDMVDIDDGDIEEGGLSEAEKKKVENMNARWKEHRDAATEPIEVQNISMMEPLPSRSIKHILEALDRMYAKYRALGIPLYRFHSDRAKEFISHQVRTWVAQRQMWQTATGGDDSASNGRVEAELAQWKRRLRLTLTSARAPAVEWPMVGRHVMEERMRLQLRKAGGPIFPKMIHYNQKVMVKTKWWHKKLQGDRHVGRLTSPYVVGFIKGPSPLMSSGWVVKGQNGYVQHARAVIQTDPDADLAILELEEDPTRPLRRLHGKQKVHDRVQQPVLVDPALRGAPGAEEPDELYEPESPLDDTVAEDFPAEVEPAAVEDGIFDDEVLRTGEPIALRALYYDDDGHGVPAKLSGGEYCSCFGECGSCFLRFGQEQGHGVSSSAVSGALGTTSRTSSSLGTSSRFGHGALGTTSRTSSTSGTSSTLGITSTLGKGSTLETRSTLKRMTSGGDGGDRRPLCVDGSVEEYED